MPHWIRDRRSQTDTPSPMEVEYAPPRMGFGRDERYDPLGPRQEEQPWDRRRAQSGGGSRSSSRGRGHRAWVPKSPPRQPAPDLATPLAENPNQSIPDPNRMDGLPIFPGLGAPPRLHPEQQKSLAIGKLVVEGFTVTAPPNESRRVDTRPRGRGGRGRFGPPGDRSGTPMMGEPQPGPKASP